jgi:hypothetical protein
VEVVRGELIEGGAQDGVLLALRKSGKSWSDHGFQDGRLKQR